MDLNPFVTLGHVVATLWKQKKNPLALFRALAPNYYVRSLDEIPQILEEKGIEGIIWDVDNTLTAYHGHEFGGDEKKVFDRLGDYPRVILSNSGEARYFELGQLFPTTPVLRMYQDIHNLGRVYYRRLYRKREGWATENGPTIQFGEVDAAERDIQDVESLQTGYRVIKKPDPRVIAYAQNVLGIEDPPKVAVIGDRMFTDVLGGNLAGCFTIQVYPLLYPQSEPKYLKPIRWMEKAVHGVYILTH